jgi:hypothetical protein
MRTIKLYDIISSESIPIGFCTHIVADFEYTNITSGEPTAEKTDKFIMINGQKHYIYSESLSEDIITTGLYRVDFLVLGRMDISIFGALRCIVDRLFTRKKDKNIKILNIQRLA